MKGAFMSCLIFCHLRTASWPCAATIQVGRNCLESGNLRERRSLALQPLPRGATVP